MKIIHSISHLELQDAFWKYFLSALDHEAEKSEIFIGLSGGSSLDIFYAYIQSHFRDIPESIRMKIRFAFLDERVVSVDHPDSNEGQLRKKFLGALVEEGSIVDDQVISVFPSCGGTKHPDSGNSGSFLSSGGRELTESYSSIVPRIDIALFGVGPDGHIASLFPYHPLLSSVERGYLEIIDSPKPPAHRITISPIMIREISYVFIAFMRGKEEAFADFRDSEKSVEECPAKFVKECKDLVVMRNIPL